MYFAMTYLLVRSSRDSPTWQSFANLFNPLPDGGALFNAFGRSGTVVQTIASPQQPGEIVVPDLPAGWYALEFSDGEFPAFFEIDVEDAYQIYFPLIVK